MDIKQIDIFGNEIDINELFLKEQQNYANRRYKTMQELHKTLEGFKCGDYKNFLRYRNRGGTKTYFKCAKWIISNSEATDIRVKDMACRKFENKE